MWLSESRQCDDMIRALKTYRSLKTVASRKASAEAIQAMAVKLVEEADCSKKTQMLGLGKYSGKETS